MLLLLPGSKGRDGGAGLQLDDEVASSAAGVNHVCRQLRIMEEQDVYEAKLAEMREKCDRFENQVDARMWAAPCWPLCALFAANEGPPELAVNLAKH